MHVELSRLWVGVVTTDVPQSSHYQMPEQEVIPRNDSYTRVMVMLETLRLTELFSKFTAAMIKVGCMGRSGSVWAHNVTPGSPSVHGLNHRHKIVTS